MFKCRSSGKTRKTAHFHVVAVMVAGVRLQFPVRLPRSSCHAEVTARGRKKRISTTRVAPSTAHHGVSVIVLALCTMMHESGGHCSHRSDGPAWSRLVEGRSWER